MEFERPKVDKRTKICILVHEGVEVQIEELVRLSQEESAFAANVEKCDWVTRKMVLESLLSEALNRELKRARKKEAARAEALFKKMEAEGLSLATSESNNQTVSQNAGVA